MAEVAAPPTEQSQTIQGKQFAALLALAAAVGLVVSFAAWCFLQGVHELQQAVFDDLPITLGYEHAPQWWSLPVCALAGLITAFAMGRLPGRGGHVPAEGLNPAPTEPAELPGVLLAAGATLGLGIVLGPEAPLIALGGGLATLAIRLAKRRAAAGRGGRGGRRRVRRDLVHLRLARDRGGDHDRGDRAGRAEAAAGARPGPAGGRHRIAGRNRHGLVNRGGHQ
jgi:H+/Cl- antiporter ClcA